LWSVTGGGSVGECGRLSHPSYTYLVRIWPRDAEALLVWSVVCACRYYEC